MIGCGKCIRCCCGLGCMVMVFCVCWGKRDEGLEIGGVSKVKIIVLMF